MDEPPPKPWLRWLRERKPSAEGGRSKGFGFIGSARAENAPPPTPRKTEAELAEELARIMARAPTHKAEPKSLLPPEPAPSATGTGETDGPPPDKE